MSGVVSPIAWPPIPQAPLSILPPSPQGNKLPETPDIGANPLNEDPPSSVEEFARDFNYTVDRYIESVSAYQEAVAEAEGVNELGERVVNLVSYRLKKTLKNITIYRDSR